MPLMKSEAEAFLREVHGWGLSPDARKIFKEFTFGDFSRAMEFANKIAPIAESEGHHPDLFVGWGRVRVELSTHAIGGLSENDFILAAKIDQIA